tara:strand:- start:33 stop:230 length:198 start_codon:yes stop_codon:yes gene_type:complete
MKETKKQEPKKVTKYKAVDPERFKASYNNVCPCYEELSEGKSVVLNTSNKIVKGWILNKQIMKEN